MKEKLITAIPMYQNDELTGIVLTSGSGSFKVYRVEPMGYDELAEFITRDIVVTGDSDGEIIWRKKTA